MLICIHQAPSKELFAEGLCLKKYVTESIGNALVRKDGRMFRREIDTMGEAGRGGTFINLEEKVASLFQPDTILPSQFFEAHRKKKYLEGEKRLMFAVLDDAIARFQNSLLPRDTKEKAQFREAENWIVKKDGDWLFSFENVCEYLELDPNTLRKKLFRRRDDEISRGAREHKRKSI